VIGIAFNAVPWQALIKDIVTPLISAIGGKPKLRHAGHFTINNSVFFVRRLPQRPAVLRDQSPRWCTYLIVGPVNRLTASDPA